MDWLTELRLSLRRLSKSPGYTTAVIVTLALVIGANSAIFSAVHAVLLNPLPIRQPGRVVVVWGANAARNLPVVELSYRNFEDWAAQSRSFSETAAVGSSAWPVVLEGRHAPVRLASPQMEGGSNEWLSELLRRLENVPGVEATGAVSLRPLALGPIGSDALVILEGQPTVAASTRLNPNVNYQVATPGYFRAMSIPLKAGRLFDVEDTGRSQRVVVVSERTASRLWPGQNPLGKRIQLPSQISNGPETWRTVIGVVGNVRYRGLDDVRLDLYEAATQSKTAATYLMVRTLRDPLTLAGTVQSEARRLDPRAIVDGVTTMEAIVGRAVAPWRFSVWMFTLFAALAFVLAILGLFSVVSLDAVNRRHEFAVRVALGARSRDVVRSTMTAAGRHLLLGLGIGVLMAALSTRAVQGMLFGVPVFDLPTYGMVIALLLAVVLGAAYFPARRAAEADPLVVLRRE